MFDCIRVFQLILVILKDGFRVHLFAMPSTYIFILSLSSFPLFLFPYLLFPYLLMQRPGLIRLGLIRHGLITLGLVFFTDDHDALGMTGIGGDPGVMTQSPTSSPVAQVCQGVEKGGGALGGSSYPIPN